MSSLQGGSVPPSGHVPVRPQNASSGIPAPTSGRMLTPTQVMAERRARDARKLEAEKQRKEESLRTQGENVVGVGDNLIKPAFSDWTPGQSQQNNPAVTTTRRRTEAVPTTNGATARVGLTTVNQGQPRPAAVQQQNPDTNYSSHVEQNRTAAFETLNQPAVAGPRQPPSQAANPPQPKIASAQTSSRATFPHAFERWETLSSHWEGLTGYWIRRLEANTDELSGKPIDQQMARQITDLSAAGANLFHAVVELQRLRASSERKFQRWFFETRNEQEQSQERMAELERQLQHERENPRTSNTEALEALETEKQKADELVKEMKRELQISKEEARRAWEELGRREQEERDRTIALRSGEPTSIGGVQVVPMAGPGFVPRQYASSQRPQTRDGPISGGPGSSRLGGQLSQEIYSRSQTTLESPDQEQAQFTYHPGGTSPTETDPFTETSRGTIPPLPLHSGSNPQLYTHSTEALPTTRNTPPGTRHQISSPQQSSRHPAYDQQQTSTARYQPMTAVIHTTTGPPRTGTAGTDRSEARSYIPSVSGTGSEEEYHINPDGSYTRDAHGRRIPYDQPIGSIGEVSDEDGEDYTAEVERERMYAQQYNRRQQRAAQGQSTQTSRPPIRESQYVSPLQGQGAFQPEDSPVSPESYTSPASATSAHRTATQYQDPVYSSADQPHPSSAAEWETITADARHRHPTRLSDIQEEQSSRTSPSRTSYISGEYPPVATSNGHQRR